MIGEPTSTAALLFKHAVGERRVENLLKEGSSNFKRQSFIRDAAAEFAGPKARSVTLPAC